MRLSTCARTTTRAGARQLGAGLLALTVVLAGCSNSSSGKAAGAGPSSVDPNQTYTLTYWSWTKGSQAAVDAFNKAHPKIHVTFQQIPSGSKGGYAKVSDAFKAGTGPDVFNAEYLALPSFVAAGQVADISRKPWTFGPTTTATNQVMAAKLKAAADGGGTLGEAIAAGQADANSEMSALGLTVRVQG